jgi:hypothetical protein
MAGTRRTSSIRPARPRVNQAAATIAVGLLGAAILAGCLTSPLPPEPVIETTDQLLDALRDAGAAIEEDPAPVQAGRLEGGRAFMMDGARLDVFEYESEAARQVAARTLTAGEGPVVLPSDGPLVAWGRGRLLVAYRGSDGGVIALIGGLLGDPLTLPQDAVDEPYPPSVAPAIAFLAQDLGVDPGRIVVVEFDATEWPDTCLGLGRPEESCTQVETAGWRIVLRLDETMYVVHSDEFGQVVRKE